MVAPPGKKGESMKNRNATPTAKLPPCCPKCGGKVIPDCHQCGERFVHGWQCIFCGETSDSYEVSR